MVPVFPKWNVWAVWAADDLTFDATMIGVSADRRLRIFVEDTASAVPGVEVADPMNPAALKGAQVELMTSAGTLAALGRKEQVPGPAMLLPGPAKLRFVRFYNRGEGGVLPSWPHTDNFLLDAVYFPEEDDPITGGPPPASLEGAIDGALDTAERAAKTTAKVVLVGLGVVGVGALIYALATSKKGRKR